MQKLKKFVQITPGYPFRGRVPTDPNGNARVIQMKDVCAEGGVDWADTVQANLGGRRKPDWLHPGDILFLLRGNDNFAMHFDEVPKPAVASPHFFHIRVKTKAPLLPKFLAWQINQEPAQRYFEKSAVGTVQRSIRRGVLEDLPIVVPTLDVQERIVNMAECAQAEIETYEKLILNRKAMLRMVASRILNEQTK